MANELLKKQQEYIRLLVKNALANPNYKGHVDLGKISKYQALKIRAATGLKLEGYRRIITADDIRHAYKKHGAEESYPNQLKITPADFELVPIIVRTDNIFWSGKSKADNLDVLLFEIVLADKFYYAEVIRTGKQQLAFRTLFKKSKISKK